MCQTCAFCGKFTHCRQGPGYAFVVANLLESRQHGAVSDGGRDEGVEGFGERVRVARERLNLDQRQLGDLVGADKSSVNRWERGRGYPQAPQLAKIAQALGESIDWLVLGAAGVRKGPVEIPAAFVEFLQTEYGSIAQAKGLVPVLLSVRLAGPATVGFYKAIVLGLLHDK